MKLEWFEVLSVFGVTSEFTVLMLMLLIALMRTSSIQIAVLSADKDLNRNWQLLALSGQLQWVLLPLQE